jgi:PAS domain S-box-containing protein
MDIRMSEEQTMQSEHRLEAYSVAFESFSKTIERLETSYTELEDRFTELNTRLQDVNIELQRALEEKERARSFLNNILFSVSSGILVYSCDGTITHCNAAAVKILGVNEFRILGSTLADLIRSDSRPDVSVECTLSGERSFDSEEKTLVRHDGSEVPVAVSTSVMKDQNGTAIGAVEVIHDLSKMRALEDEVSRIKALAALGEIAATVAHEVRNPLGGIQGFASLLKRDLPGDHPSQRLADKIIAGVENLDKSVTSLLTYAREISLSQRLVDVEGFLEDVLSYFSADINHNADKYEVLVNSPSNLKWRFDPEQFRQAIVNLLHNAVQSMPDGGKVTVSANADDSLLVTIEDDGVGIANEDLGRIFTPFFTTRESGTGLGLATVKKIVEAHRGTIGVRSTVGKGTVFSMRLPG